MAGTPTGAASSAPSATPRGISPSTRSASGCPARRAKSTSAKTPAYHPYSEEEAAKVLAEHDILVRVDMGLGSASAKAWGCDLTYDYVKINGDYRT